MPKLIFAILVLVAGVAACIILKSKGKKTLASLLMIAAVLLGLGSIALASVQTVPTGHTGVVTTFGRVENTTLDSGVHVVLPCVCSSPKRSV